MVKIMRVSYQRVIIHMIVLRFCTGRTWFNFKPHWVCLCGPLAGVRDVSRHWTDHDRPVWPVRRLASAAVDWSSQFGGDDMRAPVGRGSCHCQPRQPAVASFPLSDADCVVNNGWSAGYEWRHSATSKRGWAFRKQQTDNYERIQDFHTRWALCFAFCCEILTLLTLLRFGFDLQHRWTQLWNFQR